LTFFSKPGNIFLSIMVYTMIDRKILPGLLKKVNILV
jgi:hypothetical protein